MPASLYSRELVCTFIIDNYNPLSFSYQSWKTKYSRHRCIERWRWNNLELRQKLLDKYQCDHVRCWCVHVWYADDEQSISGTQTNDKKLILSGLLDIYEAWKHQLRDAWNVLSENMAVRASIFEISKSSVPSATGVNSITIPSRRRKERNHSPGYYGQLRKEARRRITGIACSSEDERQYMGWEEGYVSDCWKTTWKQNDGLTSSSDSHTAGTVMKPPSVI